jgi:hypothetical protein
MPPRSSSSDLASVNRMQKGTTIMFSHKLVLCSLFASISLIGCVAAHDSGSDAEDVTEEIESVDEGSEAIIGPGGGGEPDPSTTISVNLGCRIGYGSLFQPRAEITNSSAYAIPSGVKISYTVSHYYGSTAPYTSSITGPLAIGATRYVSLSYPGALDAMSCTAKASWTVVP